MSRSAADKPFNIILLGDPAAGKATQSALLVKKFNLRDFDMGKELRKRKANSKAFNNRLKDTYDKGNLTQTEICREISREIIARTPKSKGILFDGHPKMLGEAKLIARLLRTMKRRDPVVVYLAVPLGETVKRMANRVEYFKGKFSKRTDDNPTALKNRVRYYRTNISQVVAFFKSKYPYKKISGLGTRKQVSARLLQTIADLTKQQ